MSMRAVTAVIMYVPKFKPGSLEESQRSNAWWSFSLNTDHAFNSVFFLSCFTMTKLKKKEKNFPISLNTLA